MKAKSIFITAFLVLSSLTSNAQNTSLYYEGFSSGDTWPKGNNDTRELVVKNGKYYFEHKRDDKNWNITTREINIDTSKDFDIETRVTKISGDKNNAYGLLFGNKNSDNTYQFVLSDKQYRVSEEREGTYKSFKNWTTANSIKTQYNSYNILKVSKRNNKISFYINEGFVFSKSFTGFFGKKIGILVYNEQKVAIDYLKVTQGTSSIVSTNKCVWYDDFTSNKYNWATDDTEKAKLEIRDGKYYFSHKRTKGGWSSTKTMKIDPNKDFKIEAKILKISGIKNNGFGVIYGRKDSNNQFVFTINSNGSYAIDEYKDGKFTSLKDWTESKHIKKGNYATNTLKIVRENKWIKFYVNGRYLTLFYYKKFYGDRLGFVVYEKQKIAIENFNVTYLKEDVVKPKINNLVTTSKTVFLDNFSNNNNDWPTTSGESAGFEIKNNKYYFEHKRDKNGWSTSKSIPINTNRDFKIESKFLKISGIQNNGFGITFGRKDGNNEFIFNISPDGHYRVFKYKEGTYTAIKKWTKSSAIKKGNYSTNTLKVVKENGFFKFYVNNTFLYSTTFEAFMGDRIGFVIYQKQKIAIENLSISYINEKTIVEEKKDDIFISGTKVLEEYFNSNSNGWTDGNTKDRNLSVANSYYNFSHNKTEGGWAVNIPKSIDTSRDFEITSKIKKVDGATNYSYGLQWGKEEKNSFRFYITGSGYYKIARVVEGKEEIIKKFTTSSYIKKGNGKSNVLKIKKVGDVYKFYVNSNYLTQIDFEPFFGNRIGYVVYNKQTIAVDYLVINYLKSDINTIVTNTVLKAPVREPFANNSNNWTLTNSSDKVTRIDNYNLYIKNNNEKVGAFISKKIAVDTSKDFIIETSITRLTSSNGSIAFAFGRKNNTNQYDLFLSNNGDYLFRKLDKDKSIKHIPWSNTKALNTGVNQSNKIKIVKSGNLLRFYFNDQYVNEAPYSSFFGDYMGFSVYNKQEISVHYLNVTYPSVDFNTPPQVVITEPQVKRGFKIVKAKKILVKGTATDKDGIYEIIVNGIDASIKENGDFSVYVPLKVGSNDLIVKATDLKQASSTKTFTITRKTPDIVNDDVVVDNNDKNKKLDINFGEYYALLIGVSDYGDGGIADLEGLPTKDATDLSNVLINKYNFKKENVVLLNNSPKANDIIKEFIKLKNKITEKDNVLVFYAGHGVYDETTQVGHWLPSDADMTYELNLISNSQVADLLKGIRSKHTLLISDACFSGSIFKTTRDATNKPSKSIKQKFDLLSRTAITSGTLKTVPNKSIFLKYLLMKLEQNTDTYLSATKLFSRIQEPVANNSENLPRHAPIFGIGDEGGDFIFIKKSNK